MYIKCRHCGNDMFIAELEDNISAITKIRNIPSAEIKQPINTYCNNCNTIHQTFKNKLEILFYSKTIEQYLKEI